MVTTIKLQESTKHELDLFREYKNESYDEVIRKMLSIVKNVKKKPQLSKWAIKEIEEARKRIAKGNYLTEEEMWKRLGV